jgi:hypothetical protein
MNCARLGGTVAWVSFKLITSSTSPTQDRGAVLSHVPARLASQRLAVADVQDWDHSLSLSPPTIKRKTPAEASFSHRFLPNTEVGTAVHSLPASHRLALPLGDSSCLANPRFLALLLP